MPIVTYTYPFTSFPNNIIAKDALYNEVASSSITIELQSIDNDLINVYFNFKATLSAGEITTLNSIVAAHQGIPLTDTVTVIQGASGSIPWNITIPSSSNTYVTASVTNFPVTQSVFIGGSGITFTVSMSNTPLVTVTNPVTTASISNLPVTQSVKIDQVNVTVPVSVSNFPTTQTVTGTITVNNPVTSVSVNNFPATQNVSLTNTVVTQSITGSVTINNPVTSVVVSNLPTTQSVYLADGARGFSSGVPLWITGSVTSNGGGGGGGSTVDQGLSGSIPWKVSIFNSENNPNSVSAPVWITGSVINAPQNGSTTVTLDANYETYSALALSTAVALNKSMISLYNGSVNRVIKISSVKLINSQITTVNGVILEFRFLRITGHSAGTLITPQTFDTVDSLDANVTVRTGATVAGEAATPLFRYYWSGDEWGAASSKIEGTDHSNQTLSPIYSRKINEKPITLRAGEGLTIKQLTNTAIGTFDIEIIFTEE